MRGDKPSDSTPQKLPDAQDSPEELAEKKRLALDKLRLDNDEQRARIAQLQLDWWQKPKSLLVLLLPVIPLLSGVVISIAGQLSKVQRDAAEAKTKLAAIEVEKAEAARQRYEIGIERLNLDLAKLAADRQRLEAEVTSLQAAETALVQSVFERYMRVADIGGRIATAATADEARRLLGEFSTIDILGIDGSMAGLVDKIKSQIDLWKPDDGPPAKLAAAVLQLSLACKSQFQKLRRFAGPVADLRRKIYQESRDLVLELEQARDFEESKSNVRAFWRLYYGRLVLVEDDAIESAMVGAGRVIEAWNAGPPSKSDFRELRRTFETQLDRLGK